MRTPHLPLSIRSLLTLLALLGFAHLPLAAHASNGVQRCISADGILIFTDQKCADIGAVQRPDPPPVAGNIGPGFNRLKANLCARRPEDLLHGMENAIHAGDVNELAAFYHWPGVSSDGSVAIFKRLQALVDHPLLSIELLYAQPPHDARERDLPSENSPNDGGNDSRNDENHEAATPRHAYGVQIVQNRSEREPAPIRSTLSLRRNIGCWWVQF